VIFGSASRRISNAHDDVAAAVCGAIMTALQAAKRAAPEPPIVVPFFAGTPRNITGGSAYQYEPVAGPIVPSAAPSPAASPPISGYRLSFLPARSGVRRGPAILSGAPKAERIAAPKHIINVSYPGLCSIEQHI
jgi:hypothetical protein